MSSDTIVINKNKFIAITVSIVLFSLLLLTLVLYSIKIPVKPIENRSIEISEFNVSETAGKTSIANSIQKDAVIKNLEPADQKTGAALLTEKFITGNGTHSIPNGTLESNSEGISKEISSEKGSTGEPTISTSTGIGINLAGRRIEAQPTLSKDTKEEGKVVVEITVDASGKVIKADPNGRGTTTSSSVLKEKAKQTALSTKFNSSTVEEQKGTITIIFSF